MSALQYMSHYVIPLRMLTTNLFQVERKHRRECGKNREKSWDDTLKFLRETWNA